MSNIVPSLFIGLGGTGSRIVDRIAMRASRLPQWRSHLEELTQFVCLDSNSHDLKLLKNIPEPNRLLMSRFDKQRVIHNYRESNNPALHWLDRSYTPRSGFNEPPGPIRMESRLGFHVNSPAIREKLDELVRGTLRADNPHRQNDYERYGVYIYAGLSGGTGSGSFLPMAYLIQDIIRNLRWWPCIFGYFVLSTMLTKRVSPDLHRDVHANTYAALKELEHLTRLDYPEAQVEQPAGEPFGYGNDERHQTGKMVTNRPFYLSLIVDRPADLELADLEIPDPELLIGDASFLQVFSPAIGRICAEMDGYDKYLQDLSRTPGKRTGAIRGYTKHFAAFGVAALVLPASELLEYCALRFAAEAMRQQITFGASDTSEKIHGKLAELRVDYDDPKFCRRSESERYAAINRAFVLSVQTVAQEGDGVWRRLVEDVDAGKVGHVESLINRVLRLLDEERALILSEVRLSVLTFSR